MGNKEGKNQSLVVYTFPTLRPSLILSQFCPNLCGRSRLLSHDSLNRKRGVLKREAIDNSWYGKKASSVTLTTWKVERHWVLRTKAVNGYVLVPREYRIAID